MKKLLPLLVLLGCCVAWAQTPPRNATVFANLDQNNNWGSCTGSCAGGSTAYPTTYWAPFQTTPSRDGSSLKFYVDGPAWTDVLFWNKVGPHDNFTHFQFDFWMQLDSNSTTIGQAIEMDAFQFAKGTEYMFGTQCDYASGAWEIWSQGMGMWISTGVTCQKFTPNVWYHITWNFHRNNYSWDKSTYYDNVTIERYDTSNNLAARNTYTFGYGYPSGPMPATWSDDLGVQFQVDLNGQAGINGNPSTITQFVDQVKLTAW